MRSGKSREKSRLLERYFASYEKYTEFLDNTNYTGVDRKLILDFLKLGAMEECDPFVEEYLLRSVRTIISHCCCASILPWIFSTVSRNS